MANKTFLTAAAQWDRTVALVMSELVPELGHRLLLDPDPDDLDLFAEMWMIGQVITPHRLFVPGDCVVAHVNNGACHWPVWAVSRKGYRVCNYYMVHERFRLRQETDPDKRKLNTARITTFRRGPLRIVDTPGDLVGCQPDDPELRRFVLGTLRAGASA